MLLATSVAVQESWCTPCAVNVSVAEELGLSEVGPFESVQKIRFTRPPDSGSELCTPRLAGEVLYHPFVPSANEVNASVGGVASTMHSSGQETVPSSASLEVMASVALRMPWGFVPSHATYRIVADWLKAPIVFGKVNGDPGGAPSGSPLSSRKDPAPGPVIVLPVSVRSALPSFLIWIVLKVDRPGLMYISPIVVPFAGFSVSSGPHAGLVSTFMLNVFCAPPDAAQFVPPTSVARSTVRAVSRQKSQFAVVLTPRTTIQ